MRNKQVIEMWILNQSAHTKHLSTNGFNLWSYSMLIGITVGSHKYTFPYIKNFVSVTTSNHCKLARQVGEVASYMRSPHNHGYLFDETLMKDKYPR